MYTIVIDVFTDNDAELSLLINEILELAITCATHARRPKDTFENVEYSQI